MKKRGMWLGRAAALAMLVSASGAGAADVTDPALKAAIEQSQAAKAVAEADEAASKAKAAASAARAAAARAELGPLADTKVGEGKIELGTGAGTFEAQLLSAQATQAAAQTIAKAIAKRAPTATTSLQPLAFSSSIYILGGMEPLNFDVLDAFNAKAKGVKAALDNACPASEPRAETVVGTSAVAVASAVDLVARLFRSDVRMENLTVPVDQPLLVQAVAGALSGTFVDIRVPGAIAADFVRDDNDAVVTVDTVNNSRPAVAACLAAAKQLKKPDAALVARLEAALKRHDDFLAGITSPAANGTVELAVAARQAVLAKAVRGDNARVLRVSMHSAGGSIYTRRNFWTTIGMGTPVRVAGGTVVSWNLSQPLTGRVDSAGTAAITSGYQGVAQMHQREKRKSGGAGR